MKTVKVNLSNQDITHLIKRLEKLQKELEKADSQIVKELSDLGLKAIESNYSTTPYKDGNEDVSFYSTGSEKKKKIGVTGSQVLYNEFGTGTEGQNSPHPKKGEFGLNGYNTGETIRQNNSENSSASRLGIPVGELYWTYREGNVKKYTQGIPAGKQVYLAAKMLKREKDKIVKKVVGDALSKL